MAAGSKEQKAKIRNMKKIDVIYEDQEILVCRKPAGTATQTKRMGQQDMESLLRNYRAARGEDPYIGIVHRLDQPVEGVMVFAKTKRAASDLSRQVAEKQADKYYLAICENPDRSLESGQQVTLTDHLLKNGKTNTSAVVSEKTVGAKRAELNFQVLETKEEMALIRVELKTGRHHQIRVQMAHFGHPLLGDQKYNKDAVGRENVALCSVKIGFIHPVKKKKMEFTIDPLDGRFTEFTYRSSS